MNCPKCGNEAQEDAVFCDQCGTPLEQPAIDASSAPPVEAPVEQTEIAPVVEPVVELVVEPIEPTAQGLVCPGCGASTTPGEMFCSECGGPLEAPAPDPLAAVVTPPESTVDQESEMPSAKPVCPACGAAVVGDDPYCYACGADLSQPSQPVAVVTAPEPVAAVTESPAPSLAAETAGAASQTTLTECPACGASVTPGDAFCEFCGAALVTPAAIPASVADAPAAPATIVAPAASPAPTVAAPGPRLVVSASGIELPLPQGSGIIVGREDPVNGIYPDIDLTPYGAEEGGVSRRHFRITLVGTDYSIEDLNSTNSTMVNRQRLEPGTPVPLKDGDEIRAGRIRLTLKVGA